MFFSLFDRLLVLKDNFNLLQLLICFLISFLAGVVNLITIRFLCTFTLHKYFMIVAQLDSAGFFSRPGMAVSFHGSPESSIRAQGSLISVRFYKKDHSNVRPDSSTTAAPKYVNGSLYLNNPYCILFCVKIKPVVLINT
jgi:hypothetical protein